MSITSGAGKTDDKRADGDTSCHTRYNSPIQLWRVSVSACFVPGCPSPVYSDPYGRPLCRLHYEWRATSDQCAQTGCARKRVGALFCSMHRERLRLNGSLGPAAPKQRPSNQPCSVEGCEVKAKAQGYCVRHYQHWKAYGDPGPAARFRRPRGSGSIQQGYHITSKTLEHRRVWEAANGPIPEGHVIHHRNGDKLDNRLENLELMTRAQHRAHHKDDILEGKRSTR